ncbi:prenyltransferase/squalene oxidase repeat-containing protein [Luteolibacter algae]|uniref:Prenyltransferase/squalene oxidase repeat-containing protein n=1 Tax=Luteolibacter algae TaxID=454151 RepID=A0ABW5D8U0_9BACT
MSIHVQLSEEAKAKLKAQKRNSTISSIVIAAMVVVLIFLVLGIFLLPNIIKETPTIVTYSASLNEEVEVQEKKVTNQIQRKPSAPANSMTKVIASNTSSPTAIPVPDVNVDAPSVDFGDGQDFGGGWGEEGDSGSGGGFGAVPATMRKRCSKEDRMARLQEMGGNPQAEEVVEKGLEWLKANQNADGSWTGSNKAAMTGFAVLAYLGRCETPLSEKYGESCLRGITYLVNLGMKNNGKLSANLSDKHWPYEHAIASYAICEATTFSNQLSINIPNIAEVAQMATEFTLDNQHKKSGGWDYAYDTEGKRGGDLSIAAWHIQALKAANHTGLEFSGMSRAKGKALDYVESLQNKNGGFGYVTKNSPAGKDEEYFTMTGGGVLALQMWDKESAASVRNGAQYILKNSKLDYNSKDSNLYAHYYEAQAMMIRGGKEWETYNSMFKDQLIKNQMPDGSWKAPGMGGEYKNAHYRTCLNILMLEVYYRFLPGTGAK